jgi:hypothetical protein
LVGDEGGKEVEGGAIQSDWMDRRLRVGVCVGGKRKREKEGFGGSEKKSSASKQSGMLEEDNTQRERAMEKNVWGIAGWER